MRAIGARGSTLTALAVRQTLAIAVLGLLAGGVLYLAGRALITAWRPQFSVVLTPGALAGRWPRRCSWGWWPPSSPPAA